MALETMGSEQEKLWHTYRGNIETINKMSDNGHLNFIENIEYNDAFRSKNLYYIRLEENDIANYDDDSTSKLATYLKENRLTSKKLYINNVLERTWFYDDSGKHVFSVSSADSNDKSKTFIICDSINNKKLEERVYYDGIVSCNAQFVDSSQLNGIDYNKGSYLFARDYYINGDYDRTCFFDQTGNQLNCMPSINSGGMPYTIF